MFEHNGKHRILETFITEAVRDEFSRLIAKKLEEEIPRIGGVSHSIDCDPRYCSDWYKIRVGNYFHENFSLDFYFYQENAHNYLGNDKNKKNNWIKINGIYRKRSSSDLPYQFFDIFDGLITTVRSLRKE